MHEEEKYYTIEYYGGVNDPDDWTKLMDTFGYPYHFDDADAAISKATEIAMQGKWGQPIKLRVMKYIKTVNSWNIREFDPKDFYQK